jgi:hypothetical protein
MDHSGYQQYSLAQLYRAVDTVTEAEQPGLRARIEARIRELEKQEPRLEGIRGWAVGIGIGLVVAAGRMIRILYDSYPGLLSAGAWQALTAPGSATYDPAGAAFLASELVSTLALLGIYLYILYLFFTKRKVFPKWFIAVSVASLLLQVGNLWVARPLLPPLPQPSPGIMRELLDSLLRCLVWVPYVLKSRRIRQTFTR